MSRRFGLARLLCRRRRRLLRLRRRLLGLLGLLGGVLFIRVVIVLLFLLLGLVYAATVHIVQPVASVLHMIPRGTGRTLVLFGHAIVAPPVDVAKVGITVEAVLLVLAVVLGRSGH